MCMQILTPDSKNGDKKVFYRQEYHLHCRVIQNKGSTCTHLHYLANNVQSLLKREFLSSSDELCWG